MDELAVYNDMVFRDSCDLMKRHPNDINYGNSPPRTEKLSESPDYVFRRLYKVDWKVCFMRYARDHQLMAEYHAYVEDDSFVCTENLLYQAALLHKKATETQHSPVFRTGTGMFDGFDDSSTLMHKEVAIAFANHYGENGFNCSSIVDHVNSAAWNASMWLSWGNSWMRLRCDWVAVLHTLSPTRAALSVIKPNMDCTAATALNVSKHVTALAFPCADHQVVMHHGTAGELLLRASSAHVRHTCEYMLLIDKVKEPRVMYDLWNVAAVENQFHDYSEIFRHEGDTGWLLTLQLLAQEEAECVSKRGKGEGEKDCLFQTQQRRRLRQQRLHLQRGLYPRSAVAKARNTSKAVKLSNYFFGANF